VSFQLWTLRIFRWLALLTIIVSINGAWLSVYTEKPREWTGESEGEKISHVLRLTLSQSELLLLAALVWIMSLMASKYLQTRESSLLEQRIRSDR
jgi:hypothetical protein